MLKTFFHALALWLVLLPSAFAVEPRIGSFEENSLTSMETRRSGQPFLLVLWSVECQSCYSELRMLKDWRLQHPGIGLVFVNVDGKSALQDVREVISAFGLENEEFWLFGATPPERLRYVIDPLWHGELPRTYFYAPGQRREGVSGTVDETALQLWASLLPKPGKKQEMKR